MERHKMNIKAKFKLQLKKYSMNIENIKLQQWNIYKLIWFEDWITKKKKFVNAFDEENFSK